MAVHTSPRHGRVILRPSPPCCRPMAMARQNVSWRAHRINSGSRTVNMATKSVMVSTALFERLSATQKHPATV